MCTVLIDMGDQDVNFLFLGDTIKISGSVVQAAASKTLHPECTGKNPKLGGLQSAASIMNNMKYKVAIICHH